MTRDVSVAGLICALLFLCITFGSARAFASEQVFSKVRDSVVVLKVLNARGEKIRSGNREAALDALQRLQRLYPDRAEKLLKRMSPR